MIAVLSTHYYSNIPFSHPWTCWLWSRFCINGFYGVFIFFIISGFLITNVIAHNRGGLFKPDVLQFYVQRIGRIWPLFFACFFAGALLFVILPPDNPIYADFFTARGDYGFWFWLSIPFFMFNWFLIHVNNWNYSAHWMILWSLAIEEQFYLLYPLALGKLRSQKNLILFLWAIIFMAVVWRVFFYFYFRNNDFLQSFASNSKFDLIAIGILLYFSVRRYGRYLAQRPKLSFLLCATGFVLTLASFFGSRENDPLTQIYISEVLGLGVFLFLLGGLHLPLFESFFFRILALPGKYCYGCYLLHPLVRLLLLSLMSHYDYFWGFLIFILLTTLTASVSYRFFEEPLKYFFRKFFEQRPC